MCNTQDMLTIKVILLQESWLHIPDMFLFFLLIQYLDDLFRELKFNI